MIEPRVRIPGLAAGNGQGPDSTGRRTPSSEPLGRSFDDALPELRKLPGCPLGSDDDIVAMSYPPYYTACPNPFIGDWLASLDRPGDDDRARSGPVCLGCERRQGQCLLQGPLVPDQGAAPRDHAVHPPLHQAGRRRARRLRGHRHDRCRGASVWQARIRTTKAAIEAELGADNVEWGARRAILGDLGPSATFIAAGMNLPVDAKTVRRGLEATARPVRR